MVSTAISAQAGGVLDENIVAVAGDDATQARMRAVYDAHGKAIHRYLMQLTYGERRTAEDLTQETMLRAWRHLNTLSADVTALRPWLMTVARRLAIDAGRYRQARPTEVGSIDLTWLPAQDDAIDRMLSSETVRTALAQLTPEHRDVIVEVYYRGRSMTEAAAALGIPTGTVKSRSYYALRILRTALGSMAAAR